MEKLVRKFKDAFGPKESKYYFVTDGFDRKSLIKAFDGDAALLRYGEMVGHLLLSLTLEEVSEVEAAKIHFYECGRENIAYAVAQSMWDEDVVVLNYWRN